MLLLKNLGTVDDKLGESSEQGFSESASMELSSAAEEHWSDGALDVRLLIINIPFP
jgi:hypothetical protein